ncbi:MAG: AmmeMemoRadiSam system radical SAM enzyme [Candidatus Kryptoniota bacterium]
MMAETTTLKEFIESLTTVGRLWHPLENNWVLCYACGHRCRIKPGREGICKVRFNEEGQLRVPHGYVADIALDPIEKKPFYHVLPGSKALSFGMLGCDYHCAYCQNWITSQALRDPVAGVHPKRISAEEIVEYALKLDSPVIVSTYNEPLITSEWSVEIFNLAKKYGIRGAYVSNGNATRETLEYIRPYVDFYKVDLKGYDDKRYRQLGGKLETVLNTISTLHEMGFWIEIVTLLVPGFNDAEEEIQGLTNFIASVSRDIPWHITAFHQDYKMEDHENTDSRALLRAAEIGKRSGLNFIYAGNIPGMVGKWENTYCPSCGTLLIERRGFSVLRNNIVNGLCHKCGKKIPGVWQ